MRASSQEKRRVARQFEDEIEMRYTSVSRKRKLTDGKIA